MSPAALRKKRRKRGVAVPLASMGDIAFLLIIFFMVCSNFIKEARVELEPPSHPDVEQLKESMVSVSIDFAGITYLNGQEVGGAEAIEWGVNALIQGASTPEGRTVMFKCDRNVDRGVYEPVLDAIAKAGGLIAAIGEPSPP